MSVLQENNHCAAMMYYPINKYICHCDKPKGIENYYYDRETSFRTHGIYKTHLYINLGIVLWACRRAKVSKSLERESSVFFEEQMLTSLSCNDIVVLRQRHNEENICHQLLL